MSTGDSNAIRLSGVTKRWGQSSRGLELVDLTVGVGESLAVVGPSGCGKSTLLRVIAGLEEVTQGQVELFGVNQEAVLPEKRHVGMVFQELALYPHMTVRGNWQFALRGARRENRGKGDWGWLTGREAEEWILQLAQLLEITGLLERFPSEISGGQRQRVALGRALIRRPRILLFDEPFSQLDADLRKRIRLWLGRGKQRIASTGVPATLITVTHDPVEAAQMGDRVAVMCEGRIEQVGDPAMVYRAPKNIFVAEFFSQFRLNWLDDRVFAKAGWVGGWQSRGAWPVGCELDHLLALGRVGFRPTEVKVSAAESQGDLSSFQAESGEPCVVCLARIEEKRWEETHFVCRLRIGEQANRAEEGRVALNDEITIVVSAENEHQCRLGAMVLTSVARDQLLLFEHQSGNRLTFV